MSNSDDLPLEVAHLVSDPDWRSRLRNMVDAEFATETAALSSETAMLQGDLESVNKQLREADHRAREVDAYVHVSGAAGESRAADAGATYEYTVVEKIKLGIYATLAVILLVADMVLFYAGISQSPLRSFISENGNALLCFLAIVPAVAFVIKQLPELTHTSDSRAYARWRMLYAVVAIVAGVVWTWSYLKGINPVTSAGADVAAPASVIHTALPLVRGPLSLPFLRDDPASSLMGSGVIVAFFWSGIIGTTVGSAFLLMGCEHITTARGRVARNPVREMLDAGVVKLRKIRDEQSQTLGAVRARLGQLIKTRQERERRLSETILRRQEKLEAEQRARARQEEEERRNVARQEAEELRNRKRQERADFVEYLEDLRKRYEATSEVKADPILVSLKEQIESATKAIQEIDRELGSL